MQRRHHLSILAATLAGAAGLTWAATAIVADEALAIRDAKVSLIQAITAAEKHIGGMATSAEYEREGTGWVFEVDVVKADKVFDVTVDADKCTVIAAREDMADGDND